MSLLTPTDIRLFLKEYLDSKLENTGRATCGDLPEDCDLVLSGVVDSMGFLDLALALQEFVGRDIDFENLDPEQMTTVGPLCRFVSQQVSNPS
jgi:acyl carrier protein